MSAVRRPGKTALSAGLLPLVLIGCEAKAQGNGDLMLLQQHDPVVASAEQKAAETLPIFWAKFDGMADGVDHYLVKVALVAGGGGREMLWAVPLKHTADGVQVRLANEPAYLAGLKLGSVIEVSPNEIVDWSYQKGGKLYGNFVTRVTMDRAAPEERAQMQAVLAPEPLEFEVR